jgi:hypothetical protein
LPKNKKKKKKKKKIKIGKNKIKIGKNKIKEEFQNNDNSKFFIFDELIINFFFKF